MGSFGPLLSDAMLASTTPHGGKGVEL